MIADRLKKALLKNAFEGKLTKQNQSDGNSKDYVYESRKVFKELSRKDNIRWNKSLKDYTNFDEFKDIPNNWTWVKLGQIYYNKGNKKPDVTFTYIDISSIDNKSKCLGDLSNILEPNEAPSRARRIVSKGDLVYSTVRPYLQNLAYIDVDIQPEPIASTGFAVFNTFNDIMTKFLYYYLQSPDFDNYANDSDNSRGVAYPAINNKKLDEAPVPLPPLAEQKRIVKKLDQILPMIDALEKDEIHLDEIMTRFPDKMKDSILQAAMQGKLTEHNSSEVVNINQKYIENRLEMFPYEIPSNWVFAKHNEVIDLSGGSQPPKSMFVNTEKENYVRLYQIRDYGKNPVPVYIPVDKASKKAKKGDILIARYGGSLGKIFRAEDGAYNVAMTKATPRSGIKILEDYLFWFYKSPVFQKLILGQTRSAQAGFNKSNLKSLLIPIPPITEQKRIVEKLEKLLPLIESI